MADATISRPNPAGRRIHHHGDMNATGADYAEYLTRNRDNPALLERPSITGKKPARYDAGVMKPSSVSP